MRYQFMSANAQLFTVDEMCESLDVNRSGYYA